MQACFFVQSEKEAKNEAMVAVMRRCNYQQPLELFGAQGYALHTNPKLLPR